MRVKGLDGREYVWQLKGQKPNDDKSAPHLRARKLLRDLFQPAPILEEIFLPGAFTSLYLDFYLPRIKWAVEVHGKQHFEFCFHFHRTKKAFFESQKRDNRKLEWCELNEIKLIVLPEWESNVEWWERLRAN